MTKTMFLAIASMFLLVGLPVVSQAQITVDQTGLREAAANAYGSADAMDIGTYIGSNIIQPALGLVGLILLLLVLYAGFLWMTAAGNPDQVKKAKSILVNSVIGMVIIVSAYVITSAIMSELLTSNPA